MVSCQIRLFARSVLHELIHKGTAVHANASAHERAAVPVSLAHHRASMRGHEWAHVPASQAHWHRAESWEGGHSH